MVPEHESTKLLNPIQIFLYNGLNGVSVFRFELRSELWFGIKSPMPICIFVFFTTLHVLFLILESWLYSSSNPFALKIINDLLYNHNPGFKILSLSKIFMQIFCCIIGGILSIIKYYKIRISKKKSKF